MSAIDAFVRQGGWPVINSTSELVLHQDVIHVLPTGEASATVEIRRQTYTVARAPASLLETSLVAEFGFASMQLERNGGYLDFVVHFLAGGPKPEGGGTSGGPG